MPLPASAIHLLSDHFGQYTICVQCRVCRHAAEIPPSRLARRYGWNRPFEWIVANLRCAECGKKECEVEIAFEERPRGWVKNPS